MPERLLFLLTASDLKPVLSIEKESFNRPWNRSAFLAELDVQNSYSYVVKHKENDGYGPVVAYACFRIFEDEMHLLKITVSSLWKRQGIGSWLLDKCFNLAGEKEVRKVFLEVRPSNLPAISFYRMLGFQIIGQRPYYYPDTGEDALVLIKNLQEAV